MKRIAAILFTLVTLVYGVDAVYAQNRVKAEGMAMINNDRLDVARDKAIDSAQRNAVEKVMGVMISSSSEVENFQLKVDRVLSESNGFINSYNIISEGRNGVAYDVVIEADIGMGKLKDRMTAMNLIMARKSKPRVMIVFNKQENSVAEDALSRHFLSKGFKLVDSGTLKRSFHSASDQSAVVRHGHQCGAEVILLGNVDVISNSFNLSGIEMNSNKVVVSVKAINADTGDVIATRSESASAPGMKDDAKSITEEATGKVARRLVEDIFERWSSELTNTQTVKLLVTGLVSYQELAKFKECLPDAVKGYRELYQRSYRMGTAELDLEVRGDTQGVADDLALIILDPERRIRILGITQNSIEAAFK